eukprot:Nk52_evm3s343 gene=Nk52_evmTU3s343
MQLRHVSTLQEAREGAQKVTAIAWSPNNVKLAVATADKVVTLYNENGEKKDKFATKAADKSARHYVIRALAFSPDSVKLAVAQSDCIVFVYKLGAEWGEKKSICNKFLQSCPVTCMIWPISQPNLVVFGLSDGKIRVGNSKSNKSQTLYQTTSYTVSLCCNMEGTAVASGHADGSINRFFFDDSLPGASQGTMCTHSSAPYALTWAENICAAGSDRKIVIYDYGGRASQTFDYTRDDDEKEFTVAVSSPTGHSIIVGSFNRLRMFKYNLRLKRWEENGMKEIENFYTVCSLAWKFDGSRIVAGSLCGAVEVFDCCLKRTNFKGKFEFTYVSPSQVIVKRITTGTRIVLKSHYGYEIGKVNIFKDQFLIAHTSDTLLMGDLVSCKLSEVAWRGSGNEKFFFDNPQVCMIFNAGELTLVEYGINDILGSCRTEFMNPHLLSVRLNESKRRNEMDSKKIAYLVDAQTICILDLMSGVTLTTINHNSKIDWLELNTRATILLFRDKRRRLHLYDIVKESKTTLLNYCSYVQWVPFSDVAVAQNRSNLCIWYSIDDPERVTIFPIKGDIEDIERMDGSTEVIVNEGVNTVSYALDEALIEFGASVDNGDYDRAVLLLETLEMTPETEAMWKTLSQMSLEDGRLHTAERCFAALGCVAQSRYLRHVNKIADYAAQESGGDGIDHFLVRAKLAVFEKDFKAAERIYLDQGRTDDAIEMYQELHMWDQAIQVAEAKGHPELETLKANYLQWLLQTGQEDRAGQLKENAGEYETAINLYMKAGLPAMAASLICKHEELSAKQDILERTASGLMRAGLYDKAGDMYEKLRMNRQALDAYKHGNAFRRAVELARSAFPTEVVRLEEQWGDYLVTQKQMDAAINHYIEAGCSVKAIEAALASRQWNKAVQIVDIQTPDIANRYYKQLANHYAQVADYKVAEKYYVKANLNSEAVAMYTKAGNWTAAHRLASSYMSQQEVSSLYINQAQELELQGKFKDAEKLYVTVNEPDLAINMYKKIRQYADMIRLVSIYHKDLLVDTHLHLAQQLETEGNFKQAEQHFVAGNDWKSAVNMYRANDMWDDAHRVAKQHGGPNAAKQVAYLWAKTLGGESAVKLLNKFGLLESAIDYAADNGAFEFSFELAKTAMSGKIPEVHLKYAMFLEDEGRFKEAEDEFVKADKPKEAVLMYVHNRDWDNAQRVAENHDPPSVPDVLVGQARVAFESKDFGKAETFLLRAQKPEIAVKYYKENNLWDDAIRVTKEYLPHKMAQIQEEYENHMQKKPGAAKKDLTSQAKMWETQGEHSRAIDLYIKLSTADTDDLDFLEECWEKAVELAMKFTPQQANDAVRKACQKLKGIKRYEAAGDLFAGVELAKEAIDCYIIDGRWEKARRCAADLAPEHRQFIEDEYVKHLKSTGGAERLVDIDIIAGLDMFVQRGEWVKCMETAEQQGPEVVAKYSALYAASLIKDGMIEGALEVFKKYGAPANPANYNMYKHLARQVLSTCSVSSKVDTHKQSLRDLRAVLFHLIEEIKLVEPQDSPILKEFDKWLKIAHYEAMLAVCSDHENLQAFQPKISTALLRYTDELPPDKGFYEAGILCKSQGIENHAFVFLNRFLDLSEAIEEGDTSMLENSDFIQTDVPFEVTLPEKQYLTDREREDVRDWVLTVSMDQKVEQSLSKRVCESCNADIYEGTLSCHNCHNKWDPCVVTGYPVLRNRVQCKSCNKPANKDDWNKWLMSMKVCPWCGSSQNPVYNLN